MLVVFMMLTFSLVGCSDKEEKNKDNQSEEEQLMDKLSKDFNVKDKDSYKDSVAMLVEDKPVYVDEVMWYIFLIEDSMSIYSEVYEKETKEPYWEQIMDSGVTLGQMYTGDIKDQIIYNEVLSAKAVSAGIECDQENIASQAKKNMANIAKEDIEKYGKMGAC